MNNKQLKLQALKSTIVFLIIVNIVEALFKVFHIFYANESSSLSRIILTSIFGGTFYYFSILFLMKRKIKKEQSQNE
jgi:hypothetical protein